MYTDFDKLYFDSEVQTNKDTVGLAVYHLDIEMGVESTTDQVKEVIQNSRISLDSSHISAYLSQLNNALIKEGDSGFKLTAEGIEYYSEKISESEKSFKYTGKLVNLEAVSNEFYDSLVNEINQCYRNKLFDSALVMSRKLLENILIDIFRLKYGPEDHLDLYYNTERGQFLSFSKLIENFDDKSADLEHYYSTDSDEIIRKLENFRESANASAHSIETNIQKDEIDEISSDLDLLARLLADIKCKIN